MTWQHGTRVTILKIGAILKKYLLFFFFLEMSCTIEKALADAKALVERLREHDNAAEVLIEQTTALNKRVEAMKQVSSLVFVDHIQKLLVSIEPFKIICRA